MKGNALEKGAARDGAAGYCVSESVASPSFRNSYVRSVEIDSGDGHSSLLPSSCCLTGREESRRRARDARDRRAERIVRARSDVDGVRVGERRGHKFQD